MITPSIPRLTSIPRPEKLEGFFFYEPTSYAAFPRHAGYDPKSSAPVDHSLIYALIHNMTNTAFLQPLIREFCSTRLKGRADKAETLKKGLDLGYSDKMVTDFLSSRRYSLWNVLKKTIKEHRSSTVETKMVPIGGNEYRKEYHEVFSFYKEVEFTQVRKDSSVVYALYLALLCSPPEVSLMLIQEINNPEETEAVKNVIRYYDYKEMAYFWGSQRDFKESRDHVYLCYFEKFRIAYHDSLTADHGFSRYLTDKKIPEIQDNVIGLEQLEISIEKVRTGAEALYLLDQHLSATHPTHRMNYAPCCGENVENSLNLYWEKRIADAKTVENLIDIYKAGDINPFINRKDSSLTQFFCCFFCKTEPPYHSAKNKFITDLQARAIIILNSQSDLDQKNKMNRDLLTSPIFDKAHILRGVTSNHLTVLKRKEDMVLRRA